MFQIKKTPTLLLMGTSYGVLRHFQQYFSYIMAVSRMSKDFILLYYGFEDKLKRKLQTKANSIIWTFFFFIQF